MKKRTMEQKLDDIEKEYGRIKRKIRKHLNKKRRK
jgi:uncharacterized protein Yka (UPF0111/DUF47 family)